MRLVHEAEIARGACDRSAAPRSELDHEVRFADERPSHGDEVGVATLDDPFHRRRRPHGTDQDDRFRYLFPQPARRLKEISHGTWASEHPVEEQVLQGA